MRARSLQTLGKVWASSWKGLATLGIWSGQSAGKFRAWCRFGEKDPIVALPPRPTEIQPPKSLRLGASTKSCWSFHHPGGGVDKCWRVAKAVERPSKTRAKCPQGPRNIGRVLPGRWHGSTDLWPRPGRSVARAAARLGKPWARTGQGPRDLGQSVGKFMERPGDLGHNPGKCWQVPCMVSFRGKGPQWVGHLKLPAFLFKGDGGG